MSPPRLDDERVRMRAFEWLAEQRAIHGGVLPREVLAQGFTLDGRRVPLVGPQGIFKPAVLAEIPLSITTSPNGPYDDAFGEDGLLQYRYRGTDPDHADNVGLRRAGTMQRPLVYFHGLVPGRYVALWPVFIVQDEPEGLTFTVAVDDLGRWKEAPQLTLADERRRYVTRTGLQRLHQSAFRERVLQAYRRQCTICRLRHSDLLDAAHIIGDLEDRGEPVVPNGLSLCKLHHAAFDRNLIGITSNYRVEVAPRILTEEDGPMLRHGLQQMHGTSLQLPTKSTNHPDKERLATRYVDFLATW